MNSVTSIEIGSAVVVTVRPPGRTTVVRRTVTPESESSRSQARRKFLRYGSVWNDTTSAPSRPSRISLRHGSRA